MADESSFEEARNSQPLHQIRSAIIITTEGKTIVERNYWLDADTQSNLSLFGGFVASIAMMCEDIAQDEVRDIMLGSAQFVILRVENLLITLHVGFEYSRLLAMAKLRRIREALETKQQQMIGLQKLQDTLDLKQEEWQISEKVWDSIPDSPLFPSLLDDIDKIVFEPTTVDLEQVLDYFLVGENILGVELRRRSDDKILFTHFTSINEDMLKLNSVLFRVFFELMATEGAVSSDLKSSGRTFISRIGDYWLSGIQQGDLVLVSILDQHVDQSVVLDIVHGNLGDTLAYVAQYFSELA